MRDGGRVAHIISAYPMRRSDKQADRVEIHPEQLSAAAMEAECLASKLERPIQVRWDPWSWSSATHFHAYTPPNTHSHTHNYPTQTPTHTHTHTHTLKVLGWYHSHPHITVWPSHVDVGTQADYQLMDDNFIGLIFSCFNDSERVSLLHV